MTSKAERLEVYQRVRQYRQNPGAFVKQWEMMTAATREEVMLARELLKETTLSDDAVEIGLRLVQDLDIDSHRAEYTMFEAARAYAAADGRDLAECERYSRRRADGTAPAPQRIHGQLLREPAGGR